jgi:hypothetical protein
MAGLTACAWVALVPAATMILSGTAIRYAPFLFVGAALGVAASTYLARHAFRQRGDAAGPDLSAWLGYAYLIAVTGLAREWMSGRAPVIVIALVIALTGPMHGLVLLRWSNSRRGKGPRGKAALVATILAVGAGLGDVAYDRYLNEIPRARETRDSHLYLLGGVDSTSKTGALTDLDVRALGWRPAQVIVLSYRGLDLPYTAVDTHQDLDDVARRVATQIELPLMPGDALLGHSQAGLIVDRMLAAHLPVPPRVAVMAPPPTDPPRMELPPPGSTGAGAPAADLDRALAAALDAIGAPTYDASVPASPVNLDPLAVPHAEVDRLAVWALGDSVWLDGDWRRTGEINVVSISDHVGAASDERAVEVVGRFFAGRSVEGDESSWRSLLVNAIRYTFEPWRP